MRFWLVMHLLLPAWFFLLLLVFSILQWIDHAIDWLCEVIG